MTHRLQFDHCWQILLNQCLRVSIFSFTLLLSITCSVVFAAYPDKPIRIICSTAPGGSLDAMVRVIAKMLGDELKTQVYVENKPGGTGSLAMSALLNLPADGYTIVSASGSTSFLLAEGKAPFKFDDFIVLSGLQQEPSALAVLKSSPIHDLADFLHLIKLHPGTINVGGYATAGFHQLVYYRLQQLAGFRETWIPYNSGNQALLALLGKQIEASMLTPSTALGQIQNGDIRLLAISSSQRDPFFPDVPTFKEKGYNIVETLWRGLMIKKGTPLEVVSTLSTAIQKIEKTPEWKKFMLENKQSSMNLSVDEMQKHVQNEIKVRKDFLRAMGLQ
jgi:putative tricarboxylic transport membrane protein